MKSLLIDFPQDIGKEVEKALEQNGLEMGQDSIAREEFGKKAASSNYDFIFIYVHNYDIGTPQILSQIRKFLPLAKLLIITSKKDYEMAVFALRIGVCDIIQWPFCKKAISLAIQSARFFPRAHKYSKLTGLLSYFGDIRKFISAEQVFKTAVEYARDQLMAQNIGILSYHFATQSCRSLFGQRDIASLAQQDFMALFSTQREHLIKRDKVYLPFFKTLEVGYFLAFEKANLQEELEANYFFKTLSSMIGSCYEYVKKYESEEKMASLAHKDDVTGLYNQRKMYQDIAENMKQALNMKGQFSLIFLDVDNFKGINDEYGHVTGSRLLAQIAEIICKSIRGSDYVYRYGGDEFVAIFPGATASDAEKVGKRLLEKIKQCNFAVGGDQTLKLSVSIGISQYPRDAKSCDEIVSIADKMMYEAKKMGRGKIRRIGR